MGGLVTERRSARVLLLDDADRVLLFEGIDPWVPDVRFWFTPGGGIEDGEALEEAAHRELREETGIAGVDIGPVVWTGTGTFGFEGRRLRSHDSYLMVRVAAAEVDTSGFDAVEARSVLEHRWWSVDELSSTTETVYPTTLAARLTELLRDGPPAEPVDIGGGR